MYSEKETLSKRNYISVDHAVEHAGFGLAQIKYMLAACVVFFTEVQFIHLGSLTLPSISCEWDLEKWQILILLISASVTRTIGSFVGGSLSDKYGRKNNVLIGLFCMIVFGLTAVLQTNFYMFLTFRASSFFFLHCITPSALCIVLEISPRRMRFLAKMVLAVAGQLGATCSSLLAMYYLNSLGWRDLSFYMIMPCFLPLLIFFFLSDSPRYLFLSGDYDGGRKSIKQIYRMNGKQDVRHLIRNVKDQERGNVKQMFTPEFEHTTWMILGVITVKNLVVSIMHTAMPYMLQGDVCSTALKNNTMSNEKENCQGLTSKTLYSLTKGHILGIVITVVSLSMSQVVGRRRSSITCYIFAAGAMISNIWCQGKEAFILKITTANALIHGGTAIINLFIQEIYPTSIRAMTTGFFFSLGHLISTASPYVSIYLVLGHEVQFFTFGGLLFVVCAFMLLRIKHESKDAPLQETTRYNTLQSDLDWGLEELDYDSD